jgi:hypothetical protein
MTTIQDLNPNELLLETLSYLDYPDLQNCLQATKTLRATAYHPALDYKLFRSNVIKHKHDTIDIDTIVVHPILDCIFFTNKRIPPDAPGSCYTNEFLHTSFPAVQNRVHQDNVVSPLVNYIQVGRSSLESKDKSAITVSQVFKRVFRHYTRLQVEYDPSLRESHAYDVQVNRTNTTWTQWEGTNTKLECKDAVMVIHRIDGARDYLVETRSNGAAFLGADDGR